MALSKILLIVAIILFILQALHVALAFDAGWFGLAFVAGALLIGDYKV
jgi:hypothetical protein